MTRKKTMTIAVAAAVLAAGCESDQSALNEFFPQEQRATDAFAAAHAREGARHDATLQPHHFDGTELNALGREKLDYFVMARAAEGATPATAPATAPAATTIYMNVPADGAAARRTAAMAYLRDNGVDESAVKFAAGPNPSVTSPAAGHISRMNRTEGQATDEPGADEKSTPGYMPDAMTK